MSKIIGYIVIETAEEYEQPLGLDTSAALPKGGILEWTDLPRFVFTTRMEARKAIDRTEHYRLAFGTNHPERKYCKVIPLTGGFAP